MAGTAAFSSVTPILDHRGEEIGHIVTVLCTHHTDNSLSATLDATTMKYLGGTWVYKIRTKPGSTAPTDGTDLSIADSDGMSLVGVADNGLNIIDATSTLETMGYNATLGANVYLLPVRGEPWTISTANNAVASATFYIKFYCAYEVPK